MKILFRFYKEKSEITDLKKFVYQMKKHFAGSKTINRVLEKAFADENWTLINLFEESPVRLKEIYPLHRKKWKILCMFLDANRCFGFVFKYAERYWNFDPSKFQNMYLNY